MVVRLYSIIFLCALVIYSCRPTSSADDKKSSQPNILLIMADDMGFSDIGCYGSEINTPNLDQLAQNGVRFNRFYNAARCCPTRASLLTGLYPHQVGMGGMVVGYGKEKASGPYQGYLRKDSCLTIAEALKPAGYKSYMSGKWHVGESEPYWPEKRGFDNYWGLISGASSYYEIIKDQPRDRVMVKDDQRWEPPADDFYMTDATTNYAVEKINEHVKLNPNQPFFSYVAYTAPHWPLHALPDDIAKYKGMYDIGWDSLRVLRYANQKALGLFDALPPLSERPKSIDPWNSVDNKEEWSKRMEIYAAMVDRMDQGIGDIIDALKKNGQFENTIIMFLSDNGGCAENITGRKLNNPEIPMGEKGTYVAYREPWAFASNTPFRYYKAWTHEGGTTTPFILHYPKGDLTKGLVTNQTAHIIDILPTILAQSGTAYPKENLLGLQGDDIISLVKNEDQIDRELYWEHFDRRAIVDGDWKLVADKDKQWQLYNLKKDRTELQDLSKENLQQLERLQNKWMAWAKSVGVRLN